MRGVDDHRAEVLGVDRAARRGGAASTTTAGRRRPRAGVQKLGEPAVGEPADPAQLARRAAAEPHVERLLHGPDPDRHAVVVEARRRRGRRCPRSTAAASSGERLVEPRRARSSRATPNACCSTRVDHAETERGEGPAAGEHVEARPLLGEQHGVAAGQHLHRRAELELRGAAGGERQRHHRVERRRRWRAPTARASRSRSASSPSIELGEPRAAVGEALAAPSPNPMRTFTLGQLHARKPRSRAARGGRSA